MKIGIIGSVGAGKSKFGRKLRIALYKNELVEKVKVVDGYIEKLSAKTGCEYGYFASYPQNLQILFQRLLAEQEAEKEGDVISCGTIYETIIYCGILAAKAAISDVENYVNARTTMTMLGALEKMLSGYHILFYLPYSGKILMEKEHSWDLIIDRKVPEVVSGFYRSVATLGGTERENIQNAIRTVKIFREAEAVFASDEE